MNIELGASDLLMTCVNELLKALGDKEKPIGQCSPTIKKLVKDGVGHIQSGRLKEALECFSDVIQQEPRYARVRLQLLSLHLDSGDNISVIDLGGNALAYATDSRTRSQIFNLMAQAMSKMYSDHNDPAELKKCRDYYSKSIEADGCDPVPRWNMIELLFATGDSEEAKHRMRELVELVRTSGGAHRDYVDEIVEDARSVFPEDEPWSSLLGDLERANQVIVQPHRDTSLQREHFDSRIVLALCVMAAALAMASIKYVSTNAPHGPPTQVETERIDGVRATHGATRIDVSSVEFDVRQLAVVKHKPGDLV